MNSIFKAFKATGTAWLVCLSLVSTATHAADDAALRQHVHEWSELKAGSGPKADIAMTVNTLPDQKGQLMIGLYDAKTPFPDEGKHLTNAIVQVNQTASATTYTLKDIPVGDYAIAVICDENSNGKLDMHLGMIPAEPLAFSNGATVGMFGPPKYADARFTLTAAGISLNLACRK